MILLTCEQGRNDPRLDHEKATASPGLLSFWGHSPLEPSHHVQRKPRPHIEVTWKCSSQPYNTTDLVLILLDLVNNASSPLSNHLNFIHVPGTMMGFEVIEPFS